jgi:hypothetical protein
MVALPEVSIEWERCWSYQQAKDASEGVYVYTWGRRLRPYYVGQFTLFGGPKGRYADGYAHLIDAAISMGARWWQGTRLTGPFHPAVLRDLVEATLILELNPEANRRKIAPSRVVKLIHLGQVPPFLQPRA